MSYYARHTYTGNGSNKNFSVSFPYLSTTHVEVYVGGVRKTLGTDYSFVNSSTVQFVIAPATGVQVLVLRNTPKNERVVDFQDASVLTEEVLDQSSLQLFYITQEQLDEPVAAYETAQAAVAIATTAETKADTAIATANSAISTANNAVTIATEAKTDASGSALAAANSATQAATSATNAAASAAQAVESKDTAAALVAQAASSAVDSANSSVSASTSATGAALQRNIAETAAGDARSVLDAITAGYQGIQPGTAYDLGSVADSLTFFNQDLGSIA